MRISKTLGLTLFCASLSCAAFAQDATPTPSIPSVPADVVARIRDEGLNRSKVMSTLQTLCDTYGGRLTGSPNALGANKWTRDQMIGYGMRSYLESWGPFGRSWELKTFNVQVTAPTAFPLIAYPKAWSPSTRGILDTDVVIFNPQSDADYANAKGKLRGKIVLVSPPRKLSPEFEQRATRLNDAELKRLADMAPGTSAPFVLQRTPSPDAAPIFTPTATPIPAATPTPKPVLNPQIPPATGAPASNVAPGTPGPLGRPAAPGTPGTPATPGAPNGPGGRPNALAQLQRQARRLNFLRDEGAALLLDISYEGEGGAVYTMSASVAQIVPTSLPTPAPTPASAPAGPGGPGGPGGRPNFPARLAAQDEAAKGRILPQMTLSTEDYNRLYRMVSAGQKVKMRAEIVTKMESNASTYNTIGEIPGSDLKDQIVMMGGHLDSWQAASGATDNAAGVAVAMEAARILKTLGLQPRRTIRVGLWTGEEEGLLGSAAYVKQHFGSVEGERGSRKLVQGPDYDKLSAYYNLDNGAGRTRGIFAQSNTAAVPYFQNWLSPFADLSSSTVSPANTGSTDHISFDRIGLPGFQFIQDNLDYFTLTHHSNEDTVDRIPEDDLKQSAIVLATTVYQTAMMDERLPRKPLVLNPPAPAPF